MKRKREEITLWDAADVQKHKTMWHWWQWIRRRDFIGEQVHGTLIEDMANFDTKKPKTVDPNIKTTFSVGLRPTNHQRRVLNDMLRVSNHAYNWCNFLVCEKGFKPSAFDLMKIVSKTNSVDVSSEYRMEENDDWFFDNKMTDIKRTSCKNYATMHKSARSNQKKSKVELRDKDTRVLSEGSIQVSKERVRYLTAKDTSCAKLRERSIALTADNFSTTKKNVNERYLRLSKHIRKLPPFGHAVKIKKRANGKFVLQIPCDSSYTRRVFTAEEPEAICGIDPGGRTFATVYDPTNAKAFQVGLEEDKRSVMRPLHNKIDETQWHLKNAQKRSQLKAQDERISQLKKLHLKLKTFVDDIHLKLSSELVKTYRFVALGKIPVSQIVKKDRPKHLNKRANRDLLCWRHYAFRQRLLHRAAESECHVVVQNESYTSMTCGRCGTRNSTLGASETFLCKACGYGTHRDINGARNILLKALGCFPFAQ